MRKLVTCGALMGALALPAGASAATHHRHAPTLTAHRQHKMLTFSKDMAVRKATLRLHTEVGNRLATNSYPVEGGEATVDEVNHLLYMLGFPGVMDPGYYWYFWMWVQASYYNWGFDPNYCACMEEANRLSVFMASGDPEGVRQEMLYPSDNDPKWRKAAIACALAAAGPYSVAVFNHNDPGLTRADDLQSTATACAIAWIGAYFS